MVSVAGLPQVSALVHNGKRIGAWSGASGVLSTAERASLASGMLRSSIVRKPRESMGKDDAAKYLDMTPQLYDELQSAKQTPSWRGHFQCNGDDSCPFKIPYTFIKNEKCYVIGKNNNLNLSHNHALQSTIVEFNGKTRVTQKEDLTSEEAEEIRSYAPLSLTTKQSTVTTTLHSRVIMSNPPPPLDRIVIESSNVQATVLFWESHFTHKVISESSGMEVDSPAGSNHKKKRPLSTSRIIDQQPGCHAAVRISPTTVLDIVNSSAGSPGDKDNEQQTSSGGDNDYRRIIKRRKSPYDSIVLNLTASQVIDTLERFQRTGTVVSKVSEGSHGEGGGPMPWDTADRGSGSTGRYVSVHFRSPEDKLCELRTEDVDQLDAIREAALPSIQAYLRGVIHGQPQL